MKTFKKILVEVGSSLLISAAVLSILIGMYQRGYFL
jgi:hypothetical protein